MPAALGRRKTSLEGIIWYCDQDAKGGGATTWVVTFGHG